MANDFRTIARKIVRHNWEDPGTRGLETGRAPRESRPHLANGAQAQRRPHAQKISLAPARPLAWVRAPSREARPLAWGVSRSEAFGLRRLAKRGLCLGRLAKRGLWLQAAGVDVGDEDGPRADLPQFVHDLLGLLAGDHDADLDPALAVQRGDRRAVDARGDGGRLLELLRRDVVLHHHVVPRDQD